VTRWGEAEEATRMIEEGIARAKAKAKDNVTAIR
jgi:hypothetical protein